MLTDEQQLHAQNDDMQMGKDVVGSVSGQPDQSISMEVGEREREIESCSIQDIQLGRQRAHPDLEDSHNCLSQERIRTTEANLVPSSISPRSSTMDSDISWSYDHPESSFDNDYSPSDTFSGGPATAVFVSEHRDTVQNILDETNIVIYFEQIHPHWPLLHQETFKRFPYPFDVRLSVGLLGFGLKRCLNMDCVKSFQGAFSSRLQARLRQVWPTKRVIALRLDC